jgi:hypothetical protein
MHILRFWFHHRGSIVRFLKHLIDWREIDEEDYVVF